MRKTIFFIGLLALFFNVHTRGNSIIGKISDISNSTAVAGAYIYLYNTEFIDSTDENGEFSIEGIPIGKYTIIIDHPDYVQRVIKDFEVTDGINAIELNGAYNMSLRSYPNPYSNELSVEFSIDNPQHIIIEILDLQGRVLEVVENGYFLQGKHTVVWNASASSLGNRAENISICRIRGANSSQTNKIIKVQ